MSSPQKIVAFLGKGGAGKTALSALCARALVEKGLKVLLIDADPAMGLCCALALKPRKTIADARSELIRRARAARSRSDKKELAAMLDYVVLECLHETPAFCLLAMGRPESRGCYCAVNSLLRESISALAKNFDCAVIDAEAGIEQVSREVVARVTHPLVVSDASARGLLTAQAIASALKKISGIAPAGLILNRCNSPERDSRRRLAGLGMKFLGAVPEDQAILNHDRQGRSLFKLAPASPAVRAFARILGRSGL